ncbi:hypothetical protein GCM10017044_15990 [Kordiimonas sediminis]|uniref:NnrU domain-containing protein n=1 Tax=Kordiimonas sediminis TaxID=1735581 RepID=A0A919ASB6_9PROT|nr:NnrU family protein [Kordiimonas sediminis]GHF22473.1 hypothetical protein GCM10017044_15990 [Kordiimonas sediminis]
MTSPLLILGVSIFILAHLIPVYAPDFRTKTMDRMGALPYRLLFGSIAAACLYAITLGWQTSDPLFIYEPGQAVFHFMPLVTATGFIFLASAFLPTKLRNVFPDARMIGIGLWAAAHLLVNGDTRSLWLFGGFLLWSLLAIVGNHTHAAQKRQASAPQTHKPQIKYDAIAVCIGLALAAGATALHTTIIGVSPLPYAG